MLHLKIKFIYFQTFRTCKARKLTYKVMPADQMENVAIEQYPFASINRVSFIFVTKSILKINFYLYNDFLINFCFKCRFHGVQMLGVIFG